MVFEENELEDLYRRRSDLMAALDAADTGSPTYIGNSVDLQDVTAKDIADLKAQIAEIDAIIAARIGDKHA